MQSNMENHPTISLSQNMYGQAQYLRVDSKRILVCMSAMSVFPGLCTMHAAFAATFPQVL